MVSACSDASLRLHWCHSRARTSASPDLLPRQGKLCKELPISLFSLCCPAPHVPAQQRQRKPHQAANVRHDLPWTACVPKGYSDRKHHGDRTVRSTHDQSQLRTGRRSVTAGNSGARGQEAGRGAARGGAAPQQQPPARADNGRRPITPVPRGPAYPRTCWAVAPSPSRRPPPAPPPSAASATLPPPPPP